jgi:DNA gyrase subunit A
LKDELVKLEELIKDLTHIIESKKRLNEVVKTELNEVRKRYKDERRTVILGSEEEVTVERFDDEKPIVNYVLGYSGKGLVRKVKLMSYSRSKVDNPTPQEIFTFEVNATSLDKVYAFTDKGNLYRLIMDNIPEARGAGQGGVPFDTLFKEALKGETPLAFYNFGESEPSGEVIVFTKGGIVKKLDWKDLQFSRTSCSYIKLKEDDSVISVETDEENKDLFYVTAKGMCARCVKNVPVYNRNASGVKGMSLDSGDYVIYATQVDDDTITEIVATSSFGTFVRRHIGSVRKIAKSGKGVKLIDLGDKKLDECLLFAKCVKETEKYLFTIVDRMGVVLHAELKDIPKNTKAGKGVSISKLGVIQPATVYCVRQ